jgi:hypothetical protein
MDFRYCCILLALGQTWHHANLGSQKAFLFGSSDNPNHQTKDYVYHVLSKLWESADFVTMHV